LQPLADVLLVCTINKKEFEAMAADYVKETGDEKTTVNSVEEAMQ
jgi:hypothetical protein